LLTREHHHNLYQTSCHPQLPKAREVTGDRPLQGEVSVGGRVKGGLDRGSCLPLVDLNVVTKSIKELGREERVSNRAILVFKGDH